MKSNRRSPPLSVVVGERRDSTGDSGRWESGAGAALMSLGSSSDPVEILPHLFLGSEYHASMQATLERLGITALLNVSHTCPNHFEELFTYKSIPVEDTGLEDISSHFAEAIEFIERIESSGGKVLVHCHAGISRSATICIAYLMSTRRLRMEEAYEFVKSRRRVVSPNFNFMEQLLTFEGQVFATEAAQPVALPVATSFCSPSVFGAVLTTASSSHSPSLATTPKTGSELGSHRSSLEASSSSSGYSSSPDARLRPPRSIFDFSAARSGHQRALAASGGSSAPGGSGMMVASTLALVGPVQMSPVAGVSGETSPIKSGASTPIMSPM